MDMRDVLVMDFESELNMLESTSRHVSHMNSGASSRYRMNGCSGGVGGLRGSPETPIHARSNGQVSSHPDFASRRGDDATKAAKLSTIQH